ncbi:hypothetical protein GCM10023237_60050 [Streptomyces coeruleoprunus]
MTEPEFSATGVRIERWPRSLTRAGEVRIEDGRLALLTSNGREIDSAPVATVRAGRPWFGAAPDAAVATVNGTRYRLTMGQRERGGPGAVRRSRGASPGALYGTAAGPAPAPVPRESRKSLAADPSGQSSAPDARGLAARFLEALRKAGGNRD